MKTKYFIFAASALVALASCSNEEYIGDNSLTSAEGDGSIQFSYEIPNATRATLEDAAAATKLGNKFIVWGEKNESGIDATTAANTVFKNYTVVYGASTAHSTISNTDDWEYVGQASYGSKLTPAAPATQTVKYWDKAASNYTFTAVSALDADITGDKVVITKKTSGTTDVYDKGYTIAVKEGATAGNIYFSDRVNGTPGSLSGAAVKLTFRNLQAKLRFGIYETVEGYSVSIDKVYYNSTNSTTNFGVDGKFIKPAAGTSFDVTYGNGTTGVENKALVAVTATEFDTYKASTSTTIMSATSIGITSNEATMDEYVSILPYPSNTTDLSFTIDYTLTSAEGETTKITGKTVNVPAAYCKWQANFAYTYLFKITDSDLTPITFDACYVEDELGNQETITTVNNPSITTYAKGQNPTQAAKAEYPTSSNIYVTVDKGGTVKTLTVGTNAKLYTVTLTNTKTSEQEGYHAAAAQTINESSVANVLANAVEATGVWALTDANNWQLSVTTVGVPTLTAVSSIAAADSPTGVAINVNGAKFTPTAAGNYVIEFIDTEDSNKKYYKIVKVVAP